MIALVRRAADVLGLRPLLERPEVERWVALGLRAACVRQPLGFVARELLGRRVLARYRLRAGGLTVFIRHGTGDVVTLGEIFDKPDYAPPAAVTGLLGAAPRILDLGANVGLFGAYALGLWPQAAITAYEPDPANAAVHRRVIEANALDDRWRLVEAAAGTHGGSVAFAAGGIALSHVARPGEVGGIDVPLADVLGEVERADLLKLDVEGAEWPILADPRFAAAPPRAIVLEHHPEGAPGPPRATLERLFAEAGLEVHSTWSTEDGHGLMWAWRRTP